MIVEYYLFYQVINLGVVAVALLYARKRYNYGFRDLLSAFRFDREIFDKVKYLTGTALIMTASMILYYELDQVVISNLLGIEAVAIYAVALSVLQLVRTFCSIVYSPYTSRYNHFVGLEDYEGLTHFVNKMVVMFAPILIVPILTLSLTADPFVISWVGEQYVDSGVLVSFLVLSFILNFVKDPISAYFVATERNSILIKYNLIVPIVFWVGVIALVSTLDTKAFAIMKFVAPGVNVIAYWMLASKDFKARGYNFLNIRQMIKSVVPTIIFVAISSWVFSHWMIEEHTKQALLINILLMACSSGVSMAFAIPFNDELRAEVARYYKSFKAMVGK